MESAEILSTRSSDMKRFILKLVLFVLIVGLFCFALGTFMYRVEKTAYLEQIHLKPEQTIVVFGDSRSAQNVNPKLITGCINLSRPGLGIALWEKRLDDIINENVNDGVNRRVLLEIHPKLIQKTYNIPKIEDYQRVWAFWWIMHPEMFKEIKFDNFLLSYMSAEFPAQFLYYIVSRIRDRKYRSAFAGGFEMPSKKGELSKSEMSLLAQEHVKEYNIEQYDLSRFERMVEALQKAGWEPIIVTYPVFAFNSESEYAETFRKVVKDFTSRHNVNWINMGSEYQSFDNWCDTSHLNFSGAEKLWHKIKDCL